MTMEQIRERIYIASQQSGSHQMECLIEEIQEDARKEQRLEIEKLKVQVALQKDALEECVRQSGADCSGGYPTEPPLHEYAVEEVTRMRKEWDKVGDDLEFAVKKIENLENDLF